MQCPYCRKNLSDAPDLAGQMVNCPECGKPFAMPGRVIVRPAGTPPPIPFPGTAPEPPALRSRAIFRPREYPALRIVIVVHYLIAALIVALFVLGEVAMLGGMFRGMVNNPRVPAEDANSLMFAFIIAQGFWIVVHAAAITLVVGAAESIRVVLDIQHNTQETAFYVKRIAP